VIRMPLLPVSSAKTSSQSVPIPIDTSDKHLLIICFAFGVDESYIQ
jgi:hypothetical protein